MRLRLFWFTPSRLRKRDENLSPYLRAGAERLNSCEHIREPRTRFRRSKSISEVFERKDGRRSFDFELDEYTQLLYDRVKREKRGVLITTGHLGNWELLVQGFAVWHEPMSYLARPIDNPLIEDLTVAMRTKFGNNPLNKNNSSRTAVRLLREGEIVGVLTDVNAHLKVGVFVPFFDVLACTTAGPATLALRTNAILFPIFCVYDHGARRYKVVHGKAIEPVSTGDRDADIATTTAAYTAEIEKIIRQYPDQWLWIHKRWKTRPPGEPPLY